jgi:hypothetical protein
MEKQELERIISDNSKKIDKTKKTIFNPLLFSVAATGGIAAFFSLCGLSAGLFPVSELINEIGWWMSVLSIATIPTLFFGMREVNGIKKDEIEELTKELNSAKWNLERIKEAEEKKLTKEEEIVDAPSYTISNVMSSTSNKPLVRSLTRKF